MKSLENSFICIVTYFIFFVTILGHNIQTVFGYYKPILNYNGWTKYMKKIKINNNKKNIVE